MARRERQDLQNNRRRERRAIPGQVPDQEVADEPGTPMPQPGTPAPGREPRRPQPQKQPQQQPRRQTDPQRRSK
ncbi:MAG: hypothetical protein WD535_02760 [Thermaerobacterales bacterium]